MSEWIRVEDRLPEHGQIVLVYMPEKKFSYETTTDAVFNMNGRFYIWNDQAGEHVSEAPAVTHWQPLPPPPTESAVITLDYDCTGDRDRAMTPLTHPKE